MLNYREVLANNIIKYRKKKGLTREELSLSLGFDNSYISKLEKGKLNITLDRIVAIANCLGVKLSDLFKVG